jgi:hypothetical protein
VLQNVFSGIALGTYWRGSLSEEGNGPNDTDIALRRLLHTTLDFGGHGRWENVQVGANRHGWGMCMLTRVLRTLVQTCAAPKSRLWAIWEGGNLPCVYNGPKNGLMMCTPVHKSTAYRHCVFGKVRAEDMFGRQIAMAGE